MPTLPSGVEIVLVQDGEETTLTRDEGEAVASEFEAIRVSAGKYRAQAGRGGRLLVIDPVVVAEIMMFLANPAGMV
jgi:hypothetical protein